MANEEHVALLKRGVDVWNHWRADNLDVIPDLRSANLDGNDLRRTNLDRALLSVASLEDANLKGTSLVRASLDAANLHAANGSAADLRGASLVRASLTGTSLDGAHLQGARLYRADLDGASLDRARLSIASLDGASLRGASLRGANLRGAHLDQTIFQRTILNGANLDRAVIRGTVFATVDLSEVKGLATVQHRGPSTIGIDTLVLSQGKIPEVFLRGVGVPEEFITYIPSLTNRALEYYSCFISYSHADKAFARRLHDTLQGRGIRCWLDEKDLLPGHHLVTEIDRGIRLSDKILFCASRHSLTSDWVTDELTLTINKEHRLRKEQGKRPWILIPLNLDGHLFRGEEDSDMGNLIRTRMAADFTGWEHDNAKFEAEMERVIRALRADEGAEAPPLSKR